MILIILVMLPSWATGIGGCLLTELPSLTVLYIPEQSALELTSDCGLDGTKRIACKGNANHDEMIKQLACTINQEDFEDKSTKNPSTATTTTPDTIYTSTSRPTTLSIKTTRPWIWTNTVDTGEYSSPTRHRRETEDTMNPLSTQSSRDLGSTKPTMVTRKETVDVGTQTTPRSSSNGETITSAAVTVASPTKHPLEKSHSIEGESKIAETSGTPIEQTDPTATLETKVDGEYPGVINQGQLFSIIENGTVFDIVEMNETGTEFHRNVKMCSSTSVSMEFTKDQLIQMIYILGECERNPLLTSRIYQICYPNRRHPEPLALERLRDRFEATGHVEYKKEERAKPVGNENSQFADNKVKETTVAPHTRSGNRFTSGSESPEVTTRNTDILYTTVMYNKEPTEEASPVTNEVLRKSEQQKAALKDLHAQKTANDLSTKSDDKTLSKEVEMIPPGIAINSMAKLNRTNRKELPMIEDFDDSNDEIDLDIDNKLPYEKAYTRHQTVEIKLHSDQNKTKSVLFVTTKVNEKNKWAKETENVQKQTELDKITPTERPTTLENFGITTTDLPNKALKEKFLPKALQETQIISSKKPDAETLESEVENFEGTDEPLYLEPQAQPRPNRQRQLTRPQRKSFYPYFFSRMLG
ncbi:mannose phospholipase lectin receptor related [Holotrichia oblita]|uniref:Mannose phospholipase lectin receptor related n=1 Tax=Holotrichia oblita TaxID=644536 RepID=A0ACB9THF7_HOLOL|nr:mannose phospholipase lectin receptor related [Holotrichia oblita]